MTSPMVLTEDEALELLAFLVTAARTQLDEASEYGSLRLLTAAGRLADAVADRVSPATRALLTGPLRQVPELAVRTAIWAIQRRFSRPARGPARWVTWQSLTAWERFPSYDAAQLIEIVHAKQLLSIPTSQAWKSPPNFG